MICEIIMMIDDLRLSEDNSQTFTIYHLRWEKTGQNL